MWNHLQGSFIFSLCMMRVLYNIINRDHHLISILGIILATSQLDLEAHVQLPYECDTLQAETPGLLASVQFQRLHNYMQIIDICVNSWDIKILYLLMIWLMFFGVQHLWIKVLTNWQRMVISPNEVHFTCMIVLWCWQCNWINMYFNIYLTGTDARRTIRWTITENSRRPNGETGCIRERSHLCSLHGPVA